jgi:hypothetical protein
MRMLFCIERCASIELDSSCPFETPHTCCRLGRTRRDANSGRRRGSASWFNRLKSSA